MWALSPQSAVCCFLLCLCKGVFGTAAPKLHLITVINADNLFYGYPASAPIYDVAFEKARRGYNGLFDNTIRTLIHEPGFFTCADAASLMLVTVSAKISAAMSRYSDYWPAIFAPGCSLEIVALGDFAREWNVPLLSAIGSDQTLRDKNRYPTVVTFSGTDHQSTPIGVRAFLERYKWKTLTLFCDNLSQYGALATFYSLSWSNMKRTLDSELAKYVVHQEIFDTKNFVTKDFEQLLQKMKTQSRVGIFYTHPRVLRKFLITAYRLNMTGEEYVFLNSQTTTVPTLGEVTWKYDDPDDEVAFRAYGALILFSNPDPNWSKIRGTLDEYAHISADRFNKTLTSEQSRNDLALTAYESFMTFAKVLSESKEQLADVTGDAFTRRFWNRSFSFPSRDFYIGPTGMRMGDVVFSRLNVTSGLMEVSWRYYTAQNLLAQLSSLASQWKRPNEPLCGFSDNMCVSKESNLGIIVGLTSALFLVLISLGASAYYWRARRKTESAILWWMLHPNDLHEIDYSDPRSAAVFRAERRVCPSYSARIRKLGKETVWLVPVRSFATNLSYLTADKMCLQTLTALGNMQHENVGKFFGVISAALLGCFMVFEYGPRGSLRSMLQSDHINIDPVLQSSLVWDIIAGLWYIHASLKFHGGISSLVVVLDKRFCAKICGQAAPVFRLDVHADFLSDPASLWAPPEAFSNPHYEATKSGDVFSLGVLICEVLTKQTPLDTRLSDADDIEKSIQILKNFPTTPRIDLSEIPCENMRNAIRPCMDEMPSRRPRLAELGDNLKHVIPRVKLVESLTLRLQSYAQDLELTIALRAEELAAEQTRVDELLREIIPKSMVFALRNKLVVPAELYESATILFSDIPIFSKIRVVCTPLQTIALLNDVCGLCDCILSRFDVYKVETISDSYVVASGLPVRNGSRHAKEIAQMALGMLAATTTLVSPADFKQNLRLRIGINSGPCAAGIVGQRMPRYCIFGDAVNTASRMESHGLAGEIQLSKQTKSFLDQQPGFSIVSRGVISIKGKGDMETFWLKTDGAHGI